MSNLNVISAHDSSLNFLNQHISNWTLAFFTVTLGWLLHVFLSVVCSKDLWRIIQNSPLYLLVSRIWACDMFIISTVFYDLKHHFHLHVMFHLPLTNCSFSFSPSLPIFVNIITSHQVSRYLYIINYIVTFSFKVNDQLNLASCHYFMSDFILSLLFLEWDILSFGLLS